MNIDRLFKHDVKIKKTIKDLRSLIAFFHGCPISLLDILNIGKSTKDGKHFFNSSSKFLGAIIK
jgi:hypothetical protein